MNEFKGRLVKVAGMTLKFQDQFYGQNGSVTLPTTIKALVDYAVSRIGNLLTVRVDDAKIVDLTE